MRSEVTESWARSLPTVDPALESAPPAAEGARWARSPLRGPVDDLAGELLSIAEDAGFVAAVTDERGTILWTCGGRVMRRRAERVNFAPGGRWDEGAMGTNALSLALRTGHPSTVFSAEHLVAALHGWVCYCAPIHGPDGRVLGVLDLSTTWDRSHPLALPTVRTLTSAIEGRLRDAQGPAAPAGRGADLPGLVAGDQRRGAAAPAAAPVGDPRAARPGARRLLPGAAARVAVRRPPGERVHLQGRGVAPAARAGRRGLDPYATR